MKICYHPNLGRGVLTLTALLAPFGYSQVLLDENFDTDDGGFVELAEGTTPLPGVYNATAGTWAIEGDGEGPSANYLTSPTVTTTVQSVVLISFDHRYSIEGDNWDGAAIEISLNGGAFQKVEKSSFLQNGYTSGILRGNHVLNGTDAFNDDSPGYSNFPPDFITSVANLGSLPPGTDLAFRFVGAWDEFVRGAGVPNWEIDAVTIEAFPDGDSDGMPDEFEDAYPPLNKNVDDADGDLDSDQVSNLDEYLIGTNPNNDDTDGDDLLDGEEVALGTDPLNGDTDGDGLSDSVETNTGTYVNASDTGTDPLNTDTDGDGLDDGEEVEGTTDPTKRDTDGDNFSDGLEIAQGSDPNDASSVPAVATVEIIDALLGGDLTDPENDGLDFGGAGSDPLANNWNFISISANDEPDFEGGEFAFNIFDNQVGGGNAKWCCNPPSPELTVTVEFAEAISLTHFTITSGNDTPSRDPIEFFIEGSEDGTAFLPIYHRQATEEVIWTPEQRNTTALITLPRPSDPYYFFRYRVTQTGGPNHQINEIEYFGEVGTFGPLVITDFTYDPVQDQVTLTWSSKDNKQYSVFASSDLESFDLEINDSVASQGESTTLSFSSPIPGSEKLFFRVVENP